MIVTIIIIAPRTGARKAGQIQPAIGNATGNAWLNTAKNVLSVVFWAEAGHWPAVLRQIATARSGRSEKGLLSIDRIFTTSQTQHTGSV